MENIGHYYRCNRVQPSTEFHTLGKQLCESKVVKQSHGKFSASLSRLRQPGDKKNLPNPSFALEPRRVR